MDRGKNAHVLGMWGGGIGRGEGGIHSLITVSSSARSLSLSLGLVVRRQGPKS